MRQVEFERQVQNLLAKGYPEAAGLTPEDFRQRLEPLASRLAELPAMDLAPREGHAPFVIVIQRALVPEDRAIERADLKGKPGFTVMTPEDVLGFKPIAGVTLPEGVAYLMLDVDSGRDLVNVTPNEALSILEGRQRSPLTMAEGVALVTQFPETLVKNACYSLLASRCGDRRVTALWISAGKPKLGWCWAGNPHTWLGSASCGARVGAPAS